MKAVIYEKFGPPEVLQIKEIDKPKPKDNEVLIKIMATTAHKGDTRLRAFDIPYPAWQKFLAKFMLGFRGPRHKILGLELAGIVEEVGKDVTKFKIGDEVMADVSGKISLAAYAEYKCVAEDGFISLKPTNFSFEEAAALPTGAETALALIRYCDLGSGEKLLIYGASGSVGTYAVQLAKLSDVEVTGVCSTDNVDMVKSLGADMVIDYKKEDLSHIVTKFDAIIDAVGLMNQDPKPLLVQNGQFINVNKQDLSIKPEDLVYLKDLAEEGKLEVVMDRIYSLEEIVEAHRYVDTGRKKGHVAITVGSTT